MTYNPGLTGGLTPEKIRQLIEANGGDTSGDISRLFDDGTGARGSESPRERDDSPEDFGALAGRPDYYNPGAPQTLPPGYGMDYSDGVGPGEANADFPGDTPSAPDVRQRGIPESASSPGEGPSGGADYTAAPARPRTPTPQAGDAFLAQPQGALGSGMGDVGGAPNVGLRGLYGKAGGLKGGGLGLPLDPMSNAKSPEIEGLLNLTSKRRSLR